VTRKIVLIKLQTCETAKMLLFQLLNLEPIFLRTYQDITRHILVQFLPHHKLQQYVPKDTDFLQFFKF